MKRLFSGSCFVLLSLAFAPRAQATDYSIATNTSSEISFQTAANWSGGTVPANYRTWDGTNDTVYATNALASVHDAQPLAFASSNNFSTDNSYFARAFVGGANRWLNVTPHDGSWPKTLTVVDLADFAGWVYSSSSQCALRFVPDETPAQLPLVAQDNGLAVRVQGEDRRAEIGFGTGRGRIYFNTSSADTGTVHVKEPCYGDMSVLSPGYGAVTLAAEPCAAQLVGDPYLHLDATADSFVTEEKGGQVRVKTWYDCRGQEGRPYAYNSAATFIPWLATDPTSAKRVVDFGDSFSDYAWPTDNCYGGRRTGGYQGYGITSAGKLGWLKLNARVTNVREVFLVVKERYLYNCRAPFLGDDALSTNHFARGFWNDGGGTPGMWNYCYYNVGTLFHSTRASGRIRSGDIRVDGQIRRFDENISFSDRLHVLSIGTTGDVCAGRIGDAGYGTTSTGNNRHECMGGFTLGELLIYTNALTRAERAQVNAYLAAKWSTPKPACDAQKLVPGTYSAIGAATGTTFRVEKTSLANNVLTVTGGGRLETGIVEGRDGALAVKAGSVAFTKPFAAPASVPNAPAALPDAWIDPNDLSTITYTTSGEGAVTNVSRLASCAGCIHTGLATTQSGTRSYMAVGDSAQLPQPTLVADADVGGLRVLDTGAYCNGTTPSGTSTFLMMYKQVCRSTAANATTDTVSSVNGNYGTHTLFAVFKASDLRANICARYAQEIYRNKDGNGTGALFHGTSLATRWRNGDYAIDGQYIDPFNTPISANEYHVLSFRVSKSIAATCFGGRGYNQGKLGGVRFGEILLYDRVLSDTEMRETEAYLLKKWLKKDHPDYAAVTGKVSFATADFAAGADATLESALPLEVGKVTGAAGALTVKAASTASVAGLGSTITNVAAASGAVTVGASVDDLVSEALFRFDASDLGSLTTNALGQVTAWRDTRGNGYVARPLDDTTYVITNRPVWKTLAINGVEKPCIDLGPRCYVAKASSKYTVTNTAAAFQIYDPNGSTDWSPSLREWIVVAKDVTAGRDEKSSAVYTDHAPILSGTASMCKRAIDEIHNYMSHPCYTVLKGANPGVYISQLDNAAISYNYRLWQSKDQYGHNFHVFSMAYLTNHVSWTFQIRHLGGEPDSGPSSAGSAAVFGGLQLCEVMVFRTPLAAADRDTITRHLMNKWLSSGLEVGARRFGTVGVGAGATLDLALGGWTAVTADALAAGGTLVTDRALALNENATFTVRATAPQTWTALAVEGALACPVAATVALEVADGLKARDTYGDYLILSGENLTDRERMTNWTVSAPTGFYAATAPRLCLAADGLHLVIPKPGLVFLVH